MQRKLMLFLSLILIFQTLPSIAAVDALEEVNRHRAARGLSPFARDTQLSQAAAAVADYRAARLMAGHVFERNRSDYSFLPSGARAEATGCAAWPQGIGWGSCCSEENWRYAGAAYAIGRDGKRYMHLYVSNRPNSEPVSTYTPPVEQTAWRRAETGWWLMRGTTYAGYLHDNRIFQWRQADGSFSEGQVLEPGSRPK
jgi:hypothetical protein